MVRREYDDIIADAIRNLFSKDNPYIPNTSPNRYPHYAGLSTSIPFDGFDTPPDRFVFAGCNFNADVAFVPWIDNNVSAHGIHVDNYSVSFSFGGCYMAKYL